jgi:hypothetical protein
MKVVLDIPSHKTLHLQRVERHERGKSSAKWPGAVLLLVAHDGCVLTPPSAKAEDALSGGGHGSRT